MKIITNKATAALFAKVEELKHTAIDGWKCIYFNIPSDEERKVNDLVRFDANVLAHMLARMNGFAYFCETGEVFILYRGTSNSLTGRLSMYLWSLCNDKSIVPTNYQLFSHFDLRAQWDSFYRFCEKRHFESLAALENQQFMQSETPLPAELMFNDHVAGYLSN